MNITNNDKIEVNRISELIIKVDKIDAEYVNKISSEIYQYQPFLLSILIGYKDDLRLEELEEVMKIYFIIWEQFKEINIIKSKKLTEQQFDRLHERNIELLKYLDRETESKEQLDVILSDLNNLESKALLTGIHFRFDSQSTLVKMDKRKKGIILIGLKSIIDCFEEIIKIE